MKTRLSLQRSVGLIDMKTIYKSNKALDTCESRLSI